MRREGARLRVFPERRIDTRRDAAAFAALKAHWFRELNRRVDAGTPALLAYTVFSASQADLEAIAAQVRSAYEGVRAQAHASADPERVALVTFAICPLDGAPAVVARPPP